MAAPPPPPPGQKNRLGLINVLLIIFAVFGMALGIGVIMVIDGSFDTVRPEQSDGGSFSVRAGWSDWRLSGISVQMQKNDGVSQATADCAMRIIGAGTTWLEWQALGTGGQFSVIRAAEARC
jgi:hypothetical protein